MTFVLVEREFDEPVDFGGIQALEDRGAWCLQLHQVTFVRTWFARDRRRMICLYEAPDAESVRLAQRKAGMPVTCVWAAVRIEPPAPGEPAQGSGRGDEMVVVQRTFEQPLSAASIDEAIAHAQPCLARHDVLYRGGYLSQDGRRMVCVFLAADAETVRHTNRVAAVPFDRAWAATLHEPPREDSPAG